MSAPRRPARIALALSLFLSAGIVWTAFNPAPHNGGDNAAYVTLAYSMLADGSYTDLYDPAQLPHTKYPPIFPSLLALLMLLGARTWVALKAVSGIATVMAVGFTYLWAEKRLGWLPALGVALVLALSSAVVYYSHWILSDPLFLACTVAALWALDRADEEGASHAWMIAGVVAAGLAYFTRSAGLPLLVALFLWLPLRKRWKAFGVSAVALGLPALLWWLRGRGEGVAQYGTEFWLVDPYEPALGTIGVTGLFSRALGNGWAYLSVHGPGGIVGQRGGPLLVGLGVVLVALALLGWGLSMRRRIGIAEIFLPAYTGLVLLWPEVWSGDRFALPLYPLVLFYAASALREGLRRVGDLPARLVGVGAMLLLVVPAAGNWLGSTRDASACATQTRLEGPWSCYGPRVSDFAAAAEWIGQGVPDGSAVMTRKPRLFYVLSGVPSRTFPFDGDPAVQLAEADRVGARYILMDEWDGLAGRYMGEALRRYPGAFCSIRSFGASQGIGTHLFGVVPAPDRGPGGAPPGEDLSIAGCTPTYLLDGVGMDYPSSRSGRIPLLDRLDP